MLTFALFQLNPDNPVLIPGDPERGHAKLCAELGGIPYSQETFTNAVLCTVYSFNNQPIKYLVK